jgi:hydroxyacylglutathione hydrolase
VLQPREFQKQMKEGLVIDTRSPESFAGAHIPSSYNIWLDGVPAFGGWIASDNSRILLVVDSPQDMETAVKSLARIGIDSVQGVLTSGVETWREQGLPIESLPTTSAAETALWMQQGKVHVLDVRDEYEWDEKHIPGAIHSFVGYLEENLPQLPKDADIVVHCSVGHRSGLAVSLLKRHGYVRAFNMLGGITAWEQRGLPLTRSGGAKSEE